MFRVGAPLLKIRVHELGQLVVLVTRQSILPADWRERERDQFRKRMTLEE